MKVPGWSVVVGSPDPGRNSFPIPVDADAIVPARRFQRPNRIGEQQRHGHWLACVGRDKSTVGVVQDDARGVPHGALVTTGTLTDRAVGRPPRGLPRRLLL